LYVTVLTVDVADSYIKISACLTQLATADNSNLDKYEFISDSEFILSLQDFGIVPLASFI